MKLLLFLSVLVSVSIVFFYESQEVQETPESQEILESQEIQVSQKNQETPVSQKSQMTSTKVDSSSGSQKPVSEPVLAVKKVTQDKKPALAELVSKESFENLEIELVAEIEDYSTELEKVEFKKQSTNNEFQRQWMPSITESSLYFSREIERPQCFSFSCEPLGREGVLLTGFVFNTQSFSGSIYQGNYLSQTPMLYLK